MAKRDMSYVSGEVNETQGLAGLDEELEEWVGQLMMIKHSSKRG